MRLSASFGFFWKVSHFRMIFCSLRFKPIFLLLELCSSAAAFAVERAAQLSLTRRTGNWCGGARRRGACARRRDRTGTSCRCWRGRMAIPRRPWSTLPPPPRPAAAVAARATAAARAAAVASLATRAMAAAAAAATCMVCCRCGNSFGAGRLVLTLIKPSPPQQPVNILNGFTVKEKVASALAPSTRSTPADTRYQRDRAAGCAFEKCRV